MNDVAQLCIKCKTSYPLVAEAAERLLLPLISSVDCEQGFNRPTFIERATSQIGNLSIKKNRWCLNWKAKILSHFHLFFYQDNPLKS